MTTTENKIPADAVREAPTVSASDLERPARRRDVCIWGLLACAFACQKWWIGLLMVGMAMLLTFTDKESQP